MSFSGVVKIQFPLDKVRLALPSVSSLCAKLRVAAAGRGIKFDHEDTRGM